MNGILRKWREHALCSNNMDKRLRGIDKLRESNDKEAVPILMSALDDPAQEVRANAASALSAMGDPRATKSLVARVLIEREHGALERITQALAHLGMDPGITALTEALDDDDVGIRLAAARALRRVNWERVPDETRARVAILQDEWEEAASYGSAAVDALHRVLYSGTPTARRRASEALGTIGNKESLTALVDVLKSPRTDSSQRETAAWGIRRVCWECADETDLARAAIILGDWFGVVSFGPIAVGPLVDVLLDGDTELGQSVVQTLNEIRSDVALAALIQALGDSQQDVTIRQLIASLLGTREDSQSLTALVNSLGDESWSVRVAAVEALEKREWLPTLPEEKALVAILRKDWDQIPKIGEASIAALVGSLGYYTVGAEAAQALLALGAPGCDALVHALNNCDDNPTVREVASMALAECGDERAIKPLQSMLKGPDIAVRQFAVWTLERLGWEPTSKSEQATAALAHGDWDRLRKLGASAVEPLLQMAADSMARDETVATLDHILDIVPGRISIRQLQKLVSLDEIRPEYGTVPQTQTDGSAKEQDGLGRVQKRAQRELLRRGILR